MSEQSEITTPLLKMLRQMGIFCERMNSGKVQVRGGWLQLHSPGTADILAFPRGRVVWIETKTAKGKTNKEQLDNQAEFARRVRELGHEYYRVKSIDEGLDSVRKDKPQP
jgi:Holliday junction resolvase